MGDTFVSDTITADAVKMLLITANVGSIFEDPENTLKLWLTEFLKSVKETKPGFLAIHLQEVGGKNYEESMQHVNDFVKHLLACEDLAEYDRARVFLDEDFTVEDKFTALGNVYFVHEIVTDCKIWNFTENRFVELEGREVLSGSIENVPIKEKAKFPVHFFPDCRWSRKGYLRTRWCLYNVKLDMINIHLFHDASNLTAIEQTPSMYSGYRHRAFKYALDKFDTDELEKLPYFLFGDFNFRLDGHKLVKKLGNNLSQELKRNKKNNELTKLTYKNGDKEIFSVEKKSFSHHRLEEIFFDEDGKEVAEYDVELKPFLSRLFEHEINFPPTYPFSEDIDDGISYNKTRVPGWCDRILLSCSAKNLLLQDTPERQPKYHIVGHRTCMGDHKPVYLRFYLRREDKFARYSTSESKGNAKRVVSINGETVGTEHLQNINIHDYATFQHEQAIDPVVIQSFRRKGSSDKMSFHDVAKDVAVAGGVVRRWRRRSRRRRHHSSSASEEDYENGETHTEFVENESMKGSAAGQAPSVSVCLTPNGDGTKAVHEEHVVIDLVTTHSPPQTTKSSATATSGNENNPKFVTKIYVEPGLEDIANQNTEKSAVSTEQTLGPNDTRNQNGGSTDNDCVIINPPAHPSAHKQLSALSTASKYGCPCKCIIM